MTMKKFGIIIITFIMIAVFAISVNASSVNETLNRNLYNTTYNESRFGSVTTIFYDYGSWWPGDDARASTKIKVPLPTYEDGFASTVMYLNGVCHTSSSGVVINSEVNSGVATFSGSDYVFYVDHYADRDWYNGNLSSYDTMVYNNG